MSWALIASWEWLLMLGLVLGLAIAELVSVRRAIRRSVNPARGKQQAVEPTGGTTFSIISEEHRHQTRAP